jgi:hypothetical protein
MWVKLDDHFADHPKIVAVGPLAGWLFVAGLCYANRLLTDGFIPENQVDRLFIPAPPGAQKTNGGAKRTTKGGANQSAKLAHKLCEIGLWKPATVKGTSGFLIHDFLKYQPSKRRVLRERKTTAERLARWRARTGS